MAKKRTDRIRALDAINTLWNNYDAKCESIWRDGVDLMSYMLEFFPTHSFSFDPKRKAARHFTLAVIRNLYRDPRIEVKLSRSVKSPYNDGWYDFADMGPEVQREAIAEVREALFKDVEL